MEGAAMVPHGAASNPNLITAPEDLSNGAWFLGNTGTVTTNVTTDPLGTSTADKFADDVDNEQHTFRWTGISTPGSQVKYWWSIHLKAAGRTAARVLITDLGSNDCYMDVDLTARTTGGVWLSNGTFVDATAAVETPAPGWTRAIIGGTAPASTTIYCYVRLLSGGNQVYAGDGTSGVYAWGAKIERATNYSAYP